MVKYKRYYDDMGSISAYSAHNLKQLRDKGIRCVRFNPLVFIKGTLNYRDHRKILIIDGRVAFSGGVNLADEYINAVEKFLALRTRQAIALFPLLTHLYGVAIRREMNGCAITPGW